MRSRIAAGLFCVLAMLCGCDQEALLQAFVPKEEAADARRILEQLALGDLQAVKARADPAIIRPNTDAELERMARLFTRETPRDVHVVGAHTNFTGDVATYDLMFEHEYPGRWVVSRIVLQRRASRPLAIVALDAAPADRSLKEANAFRLTGKSALNYLVLALAVIVPACILYAFIVCIQTPMPRRKWLWLLFIAFGIGQLSLNWSDGSYVFQPVFALLGGMGFFKSGPYAPVFLSVGIPIGAIVFLLRRKALMRRAGAAQAEGG